MLKNRLVLLASVAIVLGLLATGHAGFADEAQKDPKVGPQAEDDDKPPAKIVKPGKEHRPPRHRLEDLLPRAVAWARKTASDHRGLCRLTINVSEALEDEDALVVTIEFTDGAVALYQGGAAPETDSAILVAKPNVKILMETAERADRK